jgi:hypothetical protein
MSLITREDLDEVERHIAAMPTQAAAMYAPVLLAWCRALLGEVERLRIEQEQASQRGAEAMRKQASTYLWGIYEAAKQDPGLWGEYPERFREMAEGLDLQVVP